MDKSPTGADSDPTARAAASGTSRSRGAWPGHELLGGGSARVVLASISEGDPLGIYPRCLERMRSRAQLVSLDRLYRRCLARTAHAAPRYEGSPPLDAWLADRVEEAMADLVQEDREEERLGVPPAEPRDPRYAFVADALGVEPGLARLACIVFNDLGEDVRRTFWDVVIEGKSVHRYVAEGHGPPERVKELLRRGFLALSLLENEGDAEPKEGQDHGR